MQVNNKMLSATKAECFNTAVCVFMRMKLFRCYTVVPFTQNREKELQAMVVIRVLIKIKFG